MPQELSKSSRMLSLIEKWHRTEITKVNFCRQHSITIHSFRYWLKKYDKQKSNSKSEFVPLRIKDSSISKCKQSDVCLDFPNGVKANIITDDFELISKLIKLY